MNFICESIVKVQFRPSIELELLDYSQRIKPGHAEFQENEIVSPKSVANLKEKRAIRSFLRVQELLIRETR